MVSSCSNRVPQKPRGRIRQHCDDHDKNRSRIHRGGRTSDNSAEALATGTALERSKENERAFATHRLAVALGFLDDSKALKLAGVGLSGAAKKTILKTAKGADFEMYRDASLALISDLGRRVSAMILISLAQEIHRIPAHNKPSALKAVGQYVRSMTGDQDLEEFGDLLLELGPPPDDDETIDKA